MEFCVATKKWLQCSFAELWFAGDLFLSDQKDSPGPGSTSIGALYLWIFQETKPEILKPVLSPTITEVEQELPLRCSEVDEESSLRSQVVVLPDPPMIDTRVPGHGSCFFLVSNIFKVFAYPNSWEDFQQNVS